MVKKSSITVGCVRQTLQTTSATLRLTSALAPISILDIGCFLDETHFMFILLLFFGGKLVLYLLHVTTVLLVIHVIIIVVIVVLNH